MFYSCEMNPEIFAQAHWNVCQSLSSENENEQKN